MNGTYHNSNGIQHREFRYIKHLMNKQQYEIKKPKNRPVNQGEYQTSGRTISKAKQH